MAAGNLGSKWAKILSRSYMRDVYKHASTIFEAGRTKEAISEIETHLENILSLQAKLRENLTLTEVERIQLLECRLFTFLDKLYLALWYGRLRTCDEHGNSYGDLFIREVEQILPMLTYEQRVDHVLHAKMRYILIKIRILILRHNNETVRIMKSLYKQSTDLKRNCFHDLNCFSIALHLEMVNLSIVSRSGETESTNKILSRLDEMFERNYKFKSDAFVKEQLGVFYGFLMKVECSRNQVENTMKFSKLMLKYQPKTVKKVPSIRALPAHQYTAVVRLNSPDHELTRADVEQVEKTLAFVKNGWEKLKEFNQSNCNHHRYFTFLIHSYYFLFRTSHTEENCQYYARELMTLFEDKCGLTVLGSLELDNLDILEIYLCVCFENKRFSKIVKFCEDLKSNRTKFKLPYSYDEVINAVQNIASYFDKQVSFHHANYVTTDPFLRSMEKVLEHLEICSNGRRDYWLREGRNILIAMNPQRYKTYREGSNFYLPSIADKRCLFETGSNKSSTTSLMDVIEFSSKNLKTIFIDSHNLHHNDSDALIGKLALSYTKFRSQCCKKLKIPPENFSTVNFENGDLDLRDVITTEGNSPLCLMIIFRQITVTVAWDNDSCRDEGAYIHNLVSEKLRELKCNPQMLWIVSESIQLCSNTVPHILPAHYDNELSPLSSEETTDIEEPVETEEDLVSQNPHDAIITSSSTSTDIYSNWGCKKTLLDCMSESIAEQNTREAIEVDKIVKKMQRNVSLSPDEFMFETVRHSVMDKKDFLIRV